MTTKQIIELIVYTMSVILPSAIAILTLVKKKYFTKAFQEIWNKIDLNQQNAIERFEELNVNVKTHTVTISKYLQKQDAAERIRQITKHALEYCGSRQIAKVLQKFTQQSVRFVQAILQIGFQNTNKQQIIAKFSVSRQTSLEFLRKSGVMSQSEFQQWKEYTTKVGVGYLKQLCNIYDDVVNNKNARFLVKTQDVIQGSVRQFILFVAKIDSKTRENIYGE